MTATTHAATGSARASQSCPERRATTTPINPRITTDEEAMSVLKCRASASRAWLPLSSATRFRSRAR
jgi:hypothetical protein